MNCAVSMLQVITKVVSTLFAVLKKRSLQLTSAVFFFFFAIVNLAVFTSAPKYQQPQHQVLEPVRINYQLPLLTNQNNRNVLIHLSTAYSFFLFLPRLLLTRLLHWYILFSVVCFARYWLHADQKLYVRRYQVKYCGLHIGVI